MEELAVYEFKIVKFCALRQQAYPKPWYPSQTVSRPEHLNSDTHCVKKLKSQNI